MRSLISGKNQVSIPAAIAKQFGIRPGFQFEWTQTGQPDVLLVRVIPDPQTIAEELLGAGRQYLKSGADPIGDLVRERAAEDADDDSSPPR